MLALRPNRELCDKDLPPASTEAMICSYECTFCRGCVEDVLSNVCPNCGGGFAQRPIRPAKAWRKGTGLQNHPASTKRVHAKYSQKELRDFAAGIAHLPPEER